MNGRRVPLYPGMAFLRFITEWANEAHQMPSEVYAKYLTNPRDFKLLAEFRNYKIEKENERNQGGQGKKPF